jgi:hypothetical protein
MGGKRGTTPLKSTVAHYWANRTVFDVDLFQPACFACQRPGHHDREDTDWDTTSLQVCHLVAHAQGGTMALTNLVLLCESCHARAPVMRDPRHMMQWVNRQPSWLSVALATMKAELDNVFGDRTEETATRVFQRVTPAQFFSRFNEVVAHEAGFHGARIPYASAAAAAWEVAHELLAPARTGTKRR